VDPEAYLDVNVFVYWLGSHPTHGEKAHSWIKTVEKSVGTRCTTSTLSLYQVLVVMAGLTGTTLSDVGFLEKIYTAITGLQGLQIVPLTSRHFSRALALIRSYDVDYEDALHLAMAMDEGLNKILSNDSDFDKSR
jgi:predicted nucleic acid-binding protein